MVGCREPYAVEYAGETLSRYDVQYVPDSIKLKEIRRPRLLEASYMLAQFRLFDLEDALGEGWLKALKLEEYAPRRPQWSQAAIHAALDRRGGPKEPTPRRRCDGLAARRLVKLNIVAFAVLESCDASPVMLGDPGGELHALLLEATYRLV